MAGVAAKAKVAGSTLDRSAHRLLRRRRRAGRWPNGRWRPSAGKQVTARDHRRGAGRARRRSRSAGRPARRPGDETPPRPRAAGARPQPHRRHRGGARRMSTAVDIALTVNGERVARRVEARRHLIDFLRLDLGLMGSHTGCEHGVCGACTVRVDGSIVRGCLVLAASLDGAKVETIEGVSDSGEIRDLQDAFIARNACQCGYCTPGMLLTAADLLAVQSAADARGDPRAPLRQLLPLHRLSRHRRCGRDGRRAKRNGRRPGHERDHRSPLRRPAELLHRQVGAAPQRQEAGRGPRPVRRRHRAAAHGARGLRAQPARARQDRRASTPPRR